VDPRPGKLQRLERQVIEHARQCRRAHLLEVAAAASLADVLARPSDLLLLADPHDRAQQAIDQRLGDAAVVRVLIGPEGGFDDDEREAALAAGALPWSLGPHVLRIETAAAAAVAILRHRHPGRPACPGEDHSYNGPPAL
jgi:16S rRNA (uracil1498-N3)-methyltransferase